MIQLIKKNLALFLFSLISIIGGSHIFVTGNMRNLQLEDERYLVGGILLFLGLYILYSIIKNKNKL